MEFTGFRNFNSRVSPLPKYLDAVKLFPTPRNITKIRSWFGLVNQLSGYGQLRRFMLPFRPFFSPKVRFEWTDALDEAFKGGKREVVRAIEEGVEIFDLQPHRLVHNGDGILPLPEGMQMQRRRLELLPRRVAHLPRRISFQLRRRSQIRTHRSEALAVAWALEQSKFFTQGCDRLTVATDRGHSIRCPIPASSG